MNDLRQALTKHLIKELGSKDRVKEFSSMLRDLGIVDLRDDDQLKAVTSDGMIDTLIVLYMFGTLPKLHNIKTKIQEIIT